MQIGGTGCVSFQQNQNGSEGDLVALRIARKAGEPGWDMRGVRRPAGPGPWAQSCLRRSQCGALDTAVPAFSQPLDLSWAGASQWLSYVPNTGRGFNTKPLKSDKCPLQCASVMLRAGWDSHLLALLRAPR